MTAPTPPAKSLLAALAAYIAAHGAAAAHALVRKLAGRGRLPINDDERLARMALHLSNLDLKQHPHPLAEAARRAILDLPGLTDIDTTTGNVRESAQRRLVHKFAYCCWNVPGRGWNQGKWS